MSKNKGQINVGIAIAITTLLASLVATALGISFRANEKSDKSLEKISTVEGDIKSINTSLLYIQSSIVEIKNQLIKDGRIMMK